MKKIFQVLIIACFGMMIASCGGSKQGNGEFSEEAEAAVKAYEEYCTKYESLMQRSEAGDDIFDELMTLQESVGTISEALIKTEGQRNDDQKARVKAVEEKINELKKKAFEN